MLAGRQRMAPNDRGLAQWLYSNSRTDVEITENADVLQAACLYSVSPKMMLSQESNDQNLHHCAIAPNPCYAHTTRKSQRFPSKKKISICRVGPQRFNNSSADLQVKKFVSRFS